MGGCLSQQQIIDGNEESAIDELSMEIASSPKPETLMDDHETRLDEQKNGKRTESIEQGANPEQCDKSVVTEQQQLLQSNSDIEYDSKADGSARNDVESEVYNIETSKSVDERYLNREESTTGIVDNSSSLSRSARETEDEVTSICSSLTHGEFSTSLHEFVYNIVKSYYHSDSDLTSILMSLGLNNPNYVSLISPYLDNNDWEHILVKIWNAIHAPDCSMEERQKSGLLFFINSCIVFIDKCIQYHVLHLSVREGSTGSTPYTSPEPTDSSVGEERSVLGLIDRISSETKDMPLVPCNTISEVSIYSREFRYVKIIVSAVAGFKTVYPDVKIAIVNDPYSELLPCKKDSMEEDSCDVGLSEKAKALAKMRWQQIKCVNTMIMRITGEEDVHDIVDVNDLEKEVCEYEPLAMNFTGSLGITEHSRQKQEEQRQQNIWEEALDNLRREEQWFKAVRSGTEQDIHTMEELVYEDPNRFYHDWDPRKLINCVDNYNRTAIYLACMDCNIRVLSFLVEKNADPRIAHVIDPKTQETPLECAIRWGYVEVVKILLKQEKYCKAQITVIAECRKKCHNKEIKSMVKEAYALWKDRA